MTEPNWSDFRIILALGKGRSVTCAASEQTHWRTYDFCSIPPNATGIEVFSFSL